jgi:hypothetical protein
MYLRVTGIPFRGLKLAGPDSLENEFVLNLGKNPP